MGLSGHGNTNCALGSSRPDPRFDRNRLLGRGAFHLERQTLLMDSVRGLVIFGRL